MDTPAPGNNRRNTLYAIPATTGRSAIATVKKAKRAKFVCRGLRRWCNERCERYTSAVPEAYPRIGFYCPLHRYQRPDDDFVDPKYQNWLTRCPSFKEYQETQEEEKKTSAASDSSMLLALKTASPPVIVTKRIALKEYPRTFYGSDFVRWLRHKPDVNCAAVCQRMVESKAFLPVVPATGDKFAESTLYRLADDDGGVKAVSQVKNMDAAVDGALIRLAVVRGRDLGVFDARTGTSSPQVKVTFRENGARSDARGTLKVGRTNVVFQNVNPDFGREQGAAVPSGTASRHLGYKVHGLGESGTKFDCLTASLVDWPRTGAAPRGAAQEWADRQVDENTFEFRLPQPQLVRGDSMEKMAWAASQGDLCLTVLHTKKNLVKASTDYMGEVSIPISNLVESVGKREQGRPCVFRWMKLESSDSSRTASGSLLVRLQMYLPGQES